MTTETRLVVAEDQLPTELPFWPTLTMWLGINEFSRSLKEYFHFSIPMWVWGVMVFFTVLVWLAAIWTKKEERQVALPFAMVGGKAYTMMTGKLSTQAGNPDHGGAQNADQIP